MPWFSRLVIGMSLRRPVFAPGSDDVGFVDKVALGEVFLRILRFFPVSIIIRWLSTLISPRRWTIGPLEATVQRHSHSHTIDINNINTYDIIIIIIINYTKILKHINNKYFPVRHIFLEKNTQRKFNWNIQSYLVVLKRKKQFRRLVPESENGQI
jgi:hypothetical protein